MGRPEWPVRLSHTAPEFFGTSTSMSTCIAVQLHADSHTLFALGENDGERDVGGNCGKTGMRGWG